MSGASSSPSIRSASTPTTSVDMRGALVRAALEVLSEHGAAGLTVRNITRSAGCSTTGIYTYFGGKSGLVDAIFVEGFESFDAAVAPGLDAGDLVAAGRAYRDWALQHRTHYMVMFGGSVPDHEPSAEALGRALESFARLADGVRRSGAGADSEQRAYHLFATVHGYVMLELVGMAAATEDESAELYEQALVRVSQVR